MNQKSFCEPLKAFRNQKIESRAHIKAAAGKEELPQKMGKEAMSMMQAMSMPSEYGLDKVLEQKFEKQQMTETTFGAAQEYSECEDSSFSSQSEDEWFTERDYELIGRVMLKSSSGQLVQHFIGILDEGQILAIQ